MRYRLTIFLLLLCFSSCERVDLGAELERKEERLRGLAEYNFRGEVGAIGYRSRPHASVEQEQWVEIIFDQPYIIDQVVLAPTIRRDSKEGLQADGFPEKFEVLITDTEGKITRMQRDHAEESFLPRIAPLVLPLETPCRATSVKILAHRLGQIGWNDDYCLALSEVMIFSQDKNVALHQRVRSSERQPTAVTPTSRDLSYLTDGHLPYSMDAASGERSIAYLSGHEIGHVQEWELDLGEEAVIDTVRFHRIELNDTVPQSEAGDYAVPHKISLIGSATADFSTPITLLAEREIRSIYEIGPIMSYRLRGKGTRYLRFRFVSNSIELDYGSRLGVIGFAEIELLREGENLALGKTFQRRGDDPLSALEKRRSVHALTDGRNFYGEILPLRQWIEELAMRHELEQEIPIIEQDVMRSYTRQKRLVGVGGTVLGVGILLSWFFSWWIPRRERRRFKERFAADIHDELGANLHTISFISDQLENKALSHEDILRIKGKIRHVAERAGRAVYHMSGVLEDGDLYRGLIDDMGRAVERILSTHDHQMHVEGQDLLKTIPKKLQVDLLLFYQECLVNIGRHSDAEKFETTLQVAPRKIILQIRDFGSEITGVPPTLSKSLLRRARVLGGKVEMKTPEGGGISVRLEKSINRYLR